jgi:methionyl-tRNA formyltransferase
MRMSEGLDEGPVLMGEQVRIDALETAGSLHDKLAVVGSRMLPVALAAIERGGAREVPQAEEGVTYAKKIKAAEARIDWTRPAVEVDRHIRGLSPFPGAWFEAPSEKGPVRVKALLSRAEDGEGAPGAALDDALLIACGLDGQGGAVRLLKAQREGKGAQDAEVFLRGFPVAAGTVLA